MGEARAAARRTRSPFRLLKGEPWVGLLYDGFGASSNIARATMARAILEYPNSNNSMTDSLPTFPFPIS